MGLGQKAYAGLRGIGSKIASLFRGGMKQGQFGKEVVRGGGQKGTADLAGGIRQAQKNVFNPKGNKFSQGGGLFPPPSNMGATPY